MLAQDLLDDCPRTAQGLGDAVSIYMACVLPDGVGYLELPCVDYDDLKTLPHAVLYMGQTYVRTGWDSDRCVACFKTNREVAFRL